MTNRRRKEKKIENGQTNKDNERRKSDELDENELSDHCLIKICIFCLTLCSYLSWPYGKCTNVICRCIILMSRCKKKSFKFMNFRVQELEKENESLKKSNQTQKTNEQDKRKDNKFLNENNKTQKKNEKDKRKDNKSLNKKKSQSKKEQDPEKENTPLKERIQQADSDLQQQKDDLPTRLKELQKLLECEKQTSKERLKEVQQMLESENKKGKDGLENERKKSEDRLKKFEETNHRLKQENADASDRLKEAQKMLENERKKNEDRLKKLEENNRQLKQESADASDRLKESEQMMELENKEADKRLQEAQKMLENERKKSEDRCAELQNEISKIKAEKKDALNRLSALMGERLRDNNPAITNLNDPNRPMKLGDQFSELYENEWTDAYSDLEAKNNLDERQAINTLLDILKEIYHICTLEAKENMKKVVGNANNVEDKSLSRLKSSLKSNAGSDIEQLLKEITNSGENKTVQTYKDTCLPFIQKCVKICYYAELQDPPMFINFEPGEYFDRQYFKEYTKSGTMVGYLVWPAFHLHKDGPLMTKGVVQPKE